MTPAETPIAHWRSYRRLSVFIRPYSRELVVVLIVSLLSTSLSLAQPYISKLLIDRALLRHDMHALGTIAALMFAAVVLGFALNILASYRYVKVSAAMLFDMRRALFAHLQTLSPRFYARFRMGDLLSRLNNDIGEVQRVSGDTLLSVLSNIVFLIGSVGLMVWMNWRLFLVSVVLVPFSVYTFLRYQRKLTLLTKGLRERSADLGSFIVETILGMRTVVSLNAREHELDRFRTRNDAFVETMLRVQIASFLSGALPGTILSAATAAVFLYGGWLIFQGTMTIGTLVAFMAYHTRLLSPVQNLMGMTAGLASARVSLGRIFELFDTAPEVLERDNALEMKPLSQAILLRNVSFAHSRAPVLQDMSVDIRAGRFYAILGPSGSGKSTLADLLVRYFDPDAGTISLDGVDARHLSLQSLRREIVLVDQSPFLFNATLAENISYGCPDATQRQIEEAAGTAGLNDFIARLPEGYRTETGERGLAISVGEKQRIALARALLRQPSVLILDEPTSALDAETERLVAVNLRAAMQGKTLIVITHRPALAELADAVIVVNQHQLEAQSAG